MKPFVVGIAGGTGSGKSTLTFGLEEIFSGKVTTVHLDDYFKPPEEVPKQGGMLNYDHPDALYLERLVKDLHALKSGKTVVINSKDHRVMGEYGTASERNPTNHYPRPLVLVEGFLTLSYGPIRQLLDLKIYLDAPFELHLGRRVHFMLDEYSKQVLRPMHDRYVEPSKRYADRIIDVSKLKPVEVLQQVEQLISL